MKITSVKDARANLHEVLSKISNNEPGDPSVLIEARKALQRLYLGKEMPYVISLRDYIEMAFDEFR